jgi:hypothetical protein
VARDSTARMAGEIPWGGEVEQSGAGWSRVEHVATEDAQVRVPLVKDMSATPKQAKSGAKGFERGVGRVEGIDPTELKSESEACK